MMELDLEFLRQQDLTSLRVQEMKPAERAELLRRYTIFVDHFRIDESAEPAEPQKPVRKWVPGERPE
jgi:hypothetical protein